jgi:hypothetical protein
VQVADLQAQLDESIVAKMKIEKHKRDLEGRVDALEIAAEGNSAKVLLPLTLFL